MASDASMPRGAFFCVGRGPPGLVRSEPAARFVELQLEGAVAATTVLRGLSPVWNEAMTFQALLGARSLSISVLNYRSSGHHDVLGCCWLPLASLPLRDPVERSCPCGPSGAPRATLRARS